MKIRICWIQFSVNPAAYQLQTKPAKREKFTIFHNIPNTSLQIRVNYVVIGHPITNFNIEHFSDGYMTTLLYFDDKLALILIPNTVPLNAWVCECVSELVCELAQCLGGLHNNYIHFNFNNDNNRNCRIGNQVNLGL